MSESEQRDLPGTAEPALQIGRQQIVHSTGGSNGTASQFHRRPNHSARVDRFQGPLGLRGNRLSGGQFACEAGARIGVNRTTAKRMLVVAGGVRPRRGRDLQGRYLTFFEREEIALGIASGESIRTIARRIGRSPSTASRELARNSINGRYRASTAQVVAHHRASRPKLAKLTVNGRLRARVEADLAKRRSPEQIAGRLRREFPDDPEMQVSAETIYHSLYVQSRGALKQELTRYLRTGQSGYCAVSTARVAY